MRKSLTAFLIIIHVISGCTTHENKIGRAFYYWKTTYAISTNQQSFLKELQVSKIYLRFFDVDWSETRSANLPVAAISFQSPIDTTFHIVPVVYITNKALKKESIDKLGSLTENIFGQVNSIAEQQHIRFSELQIDCDWTESTREKYFLLLDLLKKKLHTAHKTISATIRLHQVKYPEKTGVPAVDRGMLMFYNMGKINGSDEVNSIYNEADAAKYIAAVDNYALPLDAALPTFSWAIHIRNNKAIGLLNKTTAANLNLPNFTAVSATYFLADTSFFFRGRYIMKNDVLKLEEISPGLCKAAANKLARKLKDEDRSVAIFDLDSINISRYEKKDFEEVFGSFN